MKNLKNEKDATYIKNKELCAKYPFCQYYNEYTGELLDFEMTFLDDISDGWRKAFGLQLMEELKEILQKLNINDFKFEQIKEKYGTLRIYTNYDYLKEISDLLSKYEKLSEETCAICGEPATKHTSGYILPVCDNCFEEEIKRKSHDAAVKLWKYKK